MNGEASGESLARLEDHLDKVDDRVRHIETNWKIALAIAAILGIGGGFVGTLLQTIHSNIKELERRTMRLEDRIAIIDEKLNKFESHVQAAIDKADLHIAASAENSLKAALERQLAGILGRMNTIETGFKEVRSSLTYIIVHSDKSCPQEGWSDQGVIGVIMKKQGYSDNLGTGGDFNDDWKWTTPRLCKRTP